MIVRIRAPLEHEWPICRMLLPGTPAGDPGRQFLLCAREDRPQDTGQDAPEVKSGDRPAGTPRVIAAASFRESPQAVAELRMHVIPAFRRRGVGREMVAYLAREGARSISGFVEETRERGAVAFCEVLGFNRVETLTTVEAEMAQMREYLRKLCARRPAVARIIQIVPLAQAPAAQVAELHARYVAHQQDSGLWRAQLTGAGDWDGSVAALVDGSAAGALWGGIEGETAVVRSRVAAPGPYSAWVNLLLLSAALEGAWARGARRVRFTYNSSNRDTEKLARRFRAQIVGVKALMLRPASPRP